MIFGTLHCTGTGVLLKTTVYLTINCIFLWGSFEKCSHYLFHCKKRLIFITSILWIKLNLSSFTFHLKVSQKNVNCHPALLQSLYKTFKVKLRPMYKQNGSIKLVSWICIKLLEIILLKTKNPLETDLIKWFAIGCIWSKLKRFVFWMIQDGACC